jgi:hypothetical protein
MESRSPLRWVFLLLLIVAVAVFVRWWRSPERSFKTAVHAAQKGDGVTFDKYVDGKALASQGNATYTDLASKESDIPKEFADAPFVSMVTNPQADAILTEVVTKKSYLGNPVANAGPDFLRATFKSLDSVERRGDAAIVRASFAYPDGRPLQARFRMEPKGWYWRIAAIENIDDLVRAELIEARKEIAAREKAAAESAAIERKRRADEASAKLQQMITDFNNTKATGTSAASSGTSAAATSTASTSTH